MGNPKPPRPLLLRPDALHQGHRIVAVIDDNVTIAAQHECWPRMMQGSIAVFRTRFV